MRVIGGIHKGRKLVSFQAKHIRPTTDRVKESLFSSLDPYIDESTRVLDLFSGTGSLGIEALSRGVRHVTFIENHPQSIQIIKKNLQLLQIPKEQFRILKENALSHLQKDLSLYQIILCDPPFTEKLGAKIIELLKNNPTVTTGTWMALEVSRFEPAPKVETPWSLVKEKSFGDKKLLLIQMSNPKEGSP